MKVLSQTFNYTLECVNGKKSDFSVTRMLHNYLDYTHLYENEVAMKPYHMEEVFFAVPPGAEFDCYEKLIMPFDKHTWFALMFTFSATFSTIFVVIFTRTSMRNIIFGANVNTPSLNVVAHFFGVGQNIMPQKSFARYILMVFILFSLIIRTAYQGKLFEFMSENMTKPELQSIDEILEKKYNFFPTNAYVTLYGSLKR
jgi:hypothetical protein